MRRPGVQRALVTLPVSTKDPILLTADEGNKLHVISVDRINGKTVWDCSLAPARRQYENPLNHGASSSAATDGTNVYAFFGDFGLVSYDADGERAAEDTGWPFFGRSGTLRVKLLNSVGTYRDELAV